MGFQSLMESQAGVFTRAQAIRFGLDPHVASRLIRDQTWVRVAGRAFALNDSPVGVEQMAWAATLSMAHSTVFGVSALALWRPDAPLRIPYLIQVAVPDPRRGQIRIAPRRTVVPPEERTMRRGIPIQTQEAALADSLATLAEPDADRLFAWAVSRDLVDARSFAALVERRKFSVNAPRLRRFAAMLRDGAASKLEVVFHLLMKRHRIGGWKANCPIRAAGRIVAVADVFFEAAMLALEIDGWAAHCSKKAFQRDRTRQNALVQAGCRVLRFTYDDVMKRPDYCVDQIRRALALAE